MSILNVTEIEKSSSKIEFYKNQEQINFQSLSNSFKNINNNYNTDNTQNMSEKYIELENKLNTIIKIHENYVTILNKNIEKYIDTSRTVANIFDDII